jgi:HEAT repeat protein
MLAAWILLAATPANAGELREPLMDLLNAYEHGATDADLARLGEGVPAELRAIAADEDVPHSRRGRAISALGAWPQPEVRTFLVGQLEADDAFLKRKAVHAFGRAFPDDAPQTLEPLLRADDVQLRLATVNALGRIDADEARTLLRKRAKKERNDTVRAALDKAIGGER